MDIHSKKGYPASALSNFAPHKFEFRGVSASSMEGLLQSLKYKNPEMQKHIATLVGLSAKRHAKGKNWQRTQTLYWQGEPIGRRSEEYQQLLDDAYVALFTQSEGARKALLSTGNANLEHSTGWHRASDTILTKSEFTSRLMDIRSRLQRGELEIAPENRGEGSRSVRERY